MRRYQTGCDWVCIGFMLIRLTPTATRASVSVLRESLSGTRQPNLKDGESGRNRESGGEYARHN